MVPNLSELAVRAVWLALDEDAATRDVTSLALVPREAMGRAVVRVKQDGVVAGIAHASFVFVALGAEGRIAALAADGDRVPAGTDVLRVEGPLRQLLAAERTALNLMQRMSGIATLTARFVSAVAGTRARILATRKTAPGLRSFDLAAVRAGGGEVHRESLADRILVKANHRAAARGASAGTMDELVALVSRSGVPVGVEAVDLDDLRAALVPRVEVVLLDNLPPESVAEAVRIRDAAFPGGGGPALEASGGITLENVRRYAETGVERISVGALTHSAPALDLSMKVLAL